MRQLGNEKKFGGTCIFLHIILVIVCAVVTSIEAVVLA